MTRPILTSGVLAVLKVKEFQKFLFRGNVVDLAVAVVIGAAFGSVVTALVKDLITPLVAAIFGKPDFSNLTFSVHHSQFLYGDFINAIVGFVLVAGAIFYLIVVPMGAITARMAKPKPAAAPTTKGCPECCSEIPLAAKRCMYCTSVQA